MKKAFIGIGIAFVLVIVGVNKFTIEEEAPKNLLKIDMSVEKLQKGKLDQLRAERNPEKTLTEYPENLDIQYLFLMMQNLFVGYF